MIKQGTTKAARVAVIGGGTGTYTVLKGLKKYPVHISAIVSMTDSGGSNRVLRDEFGILPTSDIRQCIVALASEDANGIIRELFTYRYSQGTGISGMTFGNLFMAALSDIYGSQKKAIKATCRLLGVGGEVIPVTFDNTHLVAHYENGEKILGEHLIDEPVKKNGNQKIVKIEVFPPAKANPEAINAIRKADCIIIGPGDLYTSIICNFVVGGVAKSIRSSAAKKIFIVNLMNKFGQTMGFRSSDYLNEINKYLGGEVVDVCLVNRNKTFPKEVLKKYKKAHSEYVVNDLKSNSKLKVVLKDLVSKNIYRSQKGDKLRRSLIRHDSDKLAKEIVKLI